MRDKITQRAKELALKDKKDLSKMHIHTWMLYLEKASFLVDQERIYDNFQKTYGK